MLNTIFWIKKRGVRPFLLKGVLILYRPSFHSNFYFNVFPLFQIIVGSMHKWEFGKPLFDSEFVGLRNYLELNYGYVSFGKSL